MIARGLAGEGGGAASGSGGSGAVELATPEAVASALGGSTGDLPTYVAPKKGL